MEIISAIYHREGLEALLETENLPTKDLPKQLDNFLVARKTGETIGTIGLEVYGDRGLLRSLAVAPKFRKQGVAGKLLAWIEAVAVSQNIGEIYLLTETATDYFTSKGYRQVARPKVPLPVQKSSEFSHVCPQSAIVMKKILTS